MKLVSWNVNGLRSCMSKGFKDVVGKLNADIFSVQETKMQQDQLDKNIKAIGNNQFFNDAKKKDIQEQHVLQKRDLLTYILELMNWLLMI